MEALKICIVQSDLLWEDPAGNRAQFDAILGGEAGKYDLFVLPEMFSTGFSMAPAGLAEEESGETVAWMQDLAGRLEAVVMGSLIIEEDGNYFNRHLAVDGNGILARYDKRHLFRMAGEDAEYQGGERRVVFELKGWRIAPMVCYDLRFPIWSRNMADAEGRYAYDLLVYVANWPAVRAAHWKTLLQARAIENQAIVLGVNRTGVDGKEIAYTGDSMIVDHVGEVLVTARNQPQLLTAVLDGTEMSRWREKFPAWRDADDQQFNWELEA